MNFKGREVAIFLTWKCNLRLQNVKIESVKIKSLIFLFFSLKNEPRKK